MAISKAKRQAVFEKSQGRCAYCHTPLTLKTLTVDHIRPKSSFASAGEADNIDNLCACCKTCNTVKADMPVKKFKTSVNSKKNEFQKLEADRRKAFAEAKRLSLEIEGKRFVYIRYLRQTTPINITSSKDTQ